jgi:hypothetical protein
VARGHGALGLGQSGLGGALGPGAGGASIAATSVVNDTATQSGVGGASARRAAAPASSRSRRLGELRCAAACCGGDALGLWASGRQRRSSGHGAVGQWAVARCQGGCWVLPCCRSVGAWLGGCGSLPVAGLG